MHLQKYLFFSNASELVTTCRNRINLRETLLTILGNLLSIELDLKIICIAIQS